MKRLLFPVTVLSLATACSSGTGPMAGGSPGTDAGSGGESDGTAGGDAASPVGDAGAADGGSESSSSSTTGPDAGSDAGAHPDAAAGAGDGGAGLGDAGAGGGADGGGADGATAPTEGGANPVAPANVPGTGKYRFTFGDVVLEVDPQTGARVDTLSLGGTNIVEPPVTDPTQWGSTFWTSPRTEWKPMTWPPPASIDLNPYTGGPSGSHLIVTSAVDPTMGISVAKDYSVDAASGWIHIGYTIGVTSAFQAAPWEDTRVPRGGLAFFPAGAMLTPGPLTLTTVSGIVWFDDASQSATSPDGSKAIADGSGGWSAYAVNGVLFLKKFTDEPVTAEAPGEGEVDIYPGPGFLELEVQGPFTSIPANGSLPWSIQWRVAKIPASVTVAAGSATLVAFAEQQAAM